MMSCTSSIVALTGIAVISIRGVITSPTETSSSLIIRFITCHSSSSSVPSRRPISVRTASSSRLTVDCSPLGVRLRDSQPRGHKIGFMTKTITRKTWAVGFASCLQCLAPRVFGMISDTISTANVSPMEKAVRKGSPNKS